MKLRLVGLTAGLVLLTLVISSTAYALPSTIPANEIERGFFVDPVPGKNGPARGAKPSPGGTGEYNTTYIYKGLHWETPLVPYRVNSASSGLDAAAVEQAVDSSFGSWQNENNLLGQADKSDIFYSDLGATTLGGAALDGTMTVSWGPLSSGTIAATYYWYNRRTKHLLDCDIIFNSTLPWSTTGDADKYDVWNIGTHEAGHTLQLNDLYSGATSELTMYGYGSLGETKKQTLGKGDMLGLERVYPLP